MDSKLLNPYYYGSLKKRLEARQQTSGQEQRASNYFIRYLSESLHNVEQDFGVHDRVRNVLHTFRANFMFSAS